jgi:hypothetical protein
VHHKKTLKVEDCLGNITGILVPIPQLRGVGTRIIVSVLLSQDNAKKNHFKGFLLLGKFVLHKLCWRSYPYLVNINILVTFLLTQHTFPYSSVNIGLWFVFIIHIKDKFLILISAAIKRVNNEISNLQNKNKANG